MMRRFDCAALVTALAVAGASTVVAATRGKIVVRVGDAAGALTVTAINDPYTNGVGNVAVLVSLSDTTRGVWVDTGTIFNSASLLPNVATGGEGTIGISDGLGFIYSPTYNGNDAVVTHHGLLMQATDPIPGTGMFSSFNSRPMMSANGTAWWISGVTATMGGASQGRAMMRCTDPSNPATIQVMFRTGDVMDGQTIDTTGIQFGYDASDNGQHLINIMDWTGATATDAAVVVDGVTVAREGFLVVGGNGTENWTSHACPSVNNHADYVFSGDTTNATSADQVIYSNGMVIAREGHVIDGVTVGGATLWTSVNNLYEVVFLGSSSQTETLFWGTGPAFSNWKKVVSVGDQIDTNNDNVADYTLTDFNASAAVAPGLSLGDDGWVYVDVDLTPIGGGAVVNAIVGFRTPRPCTGDVDGDFDVDLTDLARLLSNFGTLAGATREMGDLDGDGDVDLTDLALLLANFGTTC